MPSIGKQLAAINQPLQTGTIMIKTPVENTVDFLLPTSSPTNPILSFTLTEDMFPKLVGLTASYSCLVYLGGQMTTAGTLYTSVGKNNSFVPYSTVSVSANYYFTFLTHHIQFVAPGDTIGVKMYSSVTDSKLLYYSFFIIPIRILPYNSINKVLRDVSITTNYSPSLTGGLNPKVDSDWPYIYVQTLDVQIYNPTTIGTFNYSILIPGSTYGLVRVMYGDSSTSSFYISSATYMPLYRRIAIPTTITYRM